MSRLSSTIELVRPINCMLTGVAVLIGAIVTSGELGIPSGVAVQAFAVAALIAAGGYSVNDYFDREIDRINRPWRPIPSGRLKAVEALAVASLLFTLGLVLAAFLNPYCFSIATINSSMLALYSWKLKRKGLVGNLSIGYLAGSTFLFGGLAVGGLGKGLLILVLMAASSTVGRELIKGIEDMPGDQKLGLETFPLRHGARKAAALAILFIGAASAFSPIPYLLHIFSWAYLVFVVPSIATFLLAALIIARKQEVGDAKRASLACKVAMGLGLMAFSAGVIAKTW